MNKRALITQIIFIILAVLIIIGVLSFFQLKNNGLKITTGNLVIDVNYNKSDIQEITPPTNSTPQNKTNITVTEINTTSYPSS